MGLKTPVIVDIETDGQPAQSGRLLCVGYQLATEERAAMWSPGAEGVDFAAAGLRALLADPERPIVSMTKYDPRYLRLQGWEVSGPYYDLQVMAWVLNENQTLSLDKLAKRYVGLEMDKRLNRTAGELYFRCDDGRKVNMRVIHEDPVAFEQMLAYCVRDVEAETALFATLWARLEQTAWLDYFFEEEVPFTAALLDAECNGLPVNLDDSEALRARLEVEAEEARASLLDSASLPPGFNVNSGAQMAAYLYHPTFELADRIAHEPGAYNGMTAEAKLDAAQAVAPEGFTVLKAGRVYDQGVWTLKGRALPPTERTPKGDRWSTASPILRSNAAAMLDPWVSDFLAYRKVEKVLTTYLRVFPALAVNERGESYDQALSALRSGVRAPDAGVGPHDAPHGGVREGEVLLPAVLLGAADSGGDGRVVEAGRVPGGEATRVTAAQGGHGGGTGPDATADGGGASRERGQVGQPAGEPDALLVPAGAQAAPRDAGAFRIFGRLNQTGTKTGRLSSSTPNLQNIPAHGPLGEAVRGLFQGDLVVGDYSQLEPRLMAHFSGDPVLTDIYRSGKDTYLTTAQGIFGGEYDHDSPERGIAKTLVLAMGYGAGPAKVAQILTINGFPTADDTARAYLRELQSLYAAFFNWREAVISRVKQKGYVTTIGGRHRRLKAAFEDRRNFKNVGYGERQAVNAVVQGSAGDIVRKVMVYLADHPLLALLAQVHDELVWECRTDDHAAIDLAALAHHAETAHGFALNVPLVFEPHFGRSWFAAKEGIELPEDLNEETSGFEEE